MKNRQARTHGWRSSSVNANKSPKYDTASPKSIYNINNTVFNKCIDTAYVNKRVLIKINRLIKDFDRSIKNDIHNIIDNKTECEFRAFHSRSTHLAENGSRYHWAEFSFIFEDNISKIMPSIQGTISNNPKDSHLVNAFAILQNKDRLANKKFIVDLDDESSFFARSINIMARYRIKNTSIDYEPSCTSVPLNRKISIDITFFAIPPTDSLLDPTQEEEDYDSKYAIYRYSQEYILQFSEVINIEKLRKEFNTNNIIYFFPQVRRLLVSVKKVKPYQYKFMNGTNVVFYGDEVTLR